MDIDTDSTFPHPEILVELAAGGAIKEEAWPTLRDTIIEQLDKICHDLFPIPKLPLPPPIVRPRADSDGRLISPLPSSPAAPDSSEADKENVPAERPQPVFQELAEGELPQQIQQMLDDVKTQLQTFTEGPPHTIQRLAELVISPKKHYRYLASYLHAVDRVIAVTSSATIYPLPPAIPDMSSLGGVTESDDPAASVAWSNPVSTQPPVGSDEALGGALLTPIPWLTKQRSPPENVSAESSQSSSSAGERAGSGAQIVSEGTETIEGPNGMGSIETVSVSVNGVPSTGAARGITQGELLRQEQRAGVVPMNQLQRAHESSLTSGREAGANGEDDDGEHSDGEDDEAPHARGPEEIGVGDTGLQHASTSSHAGEGNVLETQELDLEAAVGRKHDEIEEPKREDSPMSESSAGTKREGEADLEGEPASKVIKDDVEEEKKVVEEEEIKGDEGRDDGDKMDTS